jgi:transposase-like protein
MCARGYLRFKLSYRRPVEMMAERGLSLAHTTIMRLVTGRRNREAESPQRLRVVLHRLRTIGQRWPCYRLLSTC